MKKLLLYPLLLAVALWYAAAATAQDGRLSTHILDIGAGRPAEGVSVGLYREDGAAWTLVATRSTDSNGRIADLLPAGADSNGTYKLRFDTAEYFQARNQPSIYPYIEVIFRIDGTGHYHIPITVTANGYSTYRGS